MAAAEARAREFGVKAEEINELADPNIDVGINLTTSDAPYGVTPRRGRRGQARQRKPQHQAYVAAIDAVPLGQSLDYLADPQTGIHAVAASSALWRGGQSGQDAPGRPGIRQA
jgi:hypothetical protein